MLPAGALLRGTRLRWKRRGLPAKIDWSHPMARGLVFAALFTGAGGTPTNLVDGRIGTPTAGNVLFWTPVQDYGIACQSVRASTATVDMGTRLGQSSSTVAWSCIVRCRFTQLSGVVSPVMCRFGATGGWSFDSLPASGSAPNLTVQPRVTITGVQSYPSGIDTPMQNIPGSLGFSIMPNTTNPGVRFFANGLFLATAQVFTAMTTPTANFSLFGTPGSTSSGSTDMYGCFVWNRYLTDAEHLSMERDPHQFVIFPEDMIFALLGGKATITVTSDMLIPFESQITRQTDNIIPFESLMSVLRDSNTPLESLRSLSDDLQVPLELLLTAREDAQIPTEVSISYSRDMPIPLESLYNISKDISVPVESLAAKSQDVQVPTEALASARQDAQTPIEASTSPRQDAQIPVESSRLYSADITIPDENLQSARTDQALPNELLATVRSDIIIPDEFLAGKLANLPIPLEVTAKIQSDTAVPLEFTGILTVTSDSALPLEFAATVSFDQQIALESLRRTLQDSQLPTEWLEGISVGSPIPLESKATFSIDEPLSTEFRSAFAQVGVLPFEFVVRATVPLRALLGAVLPQAGRVAEIIGLKVASIPLPVRIIEIITMPQAIKDLSPFDEGQIITEFIDFGPYVPTGVTISSIASVTCTVYEGEDPNASNVIQASQIGTAPTPNGSGITNCAVLVQLANGKGYVTYVIAAKVITSDNDQPVGWARIKCLPVGRP